MIASIVGSTLKKRGSRRVLFAFLALAPLAAVLWAPSRVLAVPVPKLDWHPCASDTQKGFDCATAKVPLNYRYPDGSTIHLAVIRHRATDPAHRLGTLFFNPGGPGSGTAALAPYLAAGYFPDALSARFDLISWDPRGIGDGTAVQCFDSQEDENRFLDGAGVAGETFPVGNAEKTAWIERYQAFGRRCEQANGKLLRHVSTAEIARDLNLLRRAVGESKLNYLGISYGTLLGATYANLFPDRVRALVVDGNVDPAAWMHKRIEVNDGAYLGTWLRQYSDRGAAKTLNAFLGRCGRADTARCAFSAGSADATRAKFDALLRRVRTDPASADISYADLVSAITAKALYSTAIWPQAAQCLQDVWTTGHWCPPASQSNLPIPGAPPAGAASTAGAGQSYAGPEQALAIICSESPNPQPVAFWELDAFAQERSGPPGPYWSWGAEPCSSWPVGAPDRYAGPWDRPTANPVLVIGNTHDPATPHRNAVAMARQLARARLLTVDGYGHTAMTNPSACVDRHESRYFIARALPPKGATCEQDYQPFTGSP